MAQGSQLVDKAGETMAEIVTAIGRVTDIMGEISAASREQSQGVAQVGEAITQMDQSTQQNAALVEESAAAADALQRQARALVDSVAIFSWAMMLRLSSILSSPAPPLQAGPLLCRAPRSQGGSRFSACCRGCAASGECGLAGRLQLGAVLAFPPAAW